MMPSNIRYSLYPQRMACWFNSSTSLNAGGVDPTTAPHDCIMPGCPGPENKRKLEAFDDLLAACQNAYTAIVNHHAAGERIAGSRCEVCKGELDMLRAAIAKAGPQAR